MESSDSDVLSRLTREIYTRYALAVSSKWLVDFLSTVRNPPPPLPALASTANFRLLNSDFTRSLGRATVATDNSPAAAFLPQNIADVNVKLSQLQENVPVQVVDILDVGSSKWSQIEAIERVERGEEVRGREIIRNLPIMNEEDGSNGPSGGPGQGPSASSGLIKKSDGPHRLLLQDAMGKMVWGFEIGAMPKVFLTATVEDGGLQIGAKMLLKKGTVVRRGLIMLEQSNVTMLGGKVDEWDKKWRTGRKAKLTDDLDRENEQQ